MLTTVVVFQDNCFPSCVIVPTSPPFNISANSINDTAIQVRFYKVPGPERNGIILFYHVTYQAVPGKGHAVRTASETRNVSEIGNQDFIEVNLYGLEGGVAYSINVSAFTIKGEGPFNSTEEWTREASKCTSVFYFSCWATNWPERHLDC